VRDYGDVTLGLLGDHQATNASVAVQLLEALDERGIVVPPAAIVEGLTSVTWPGRLDLRRLPDGREVLLDAAHNPAGAESLATFLRASGWRRSPIVFAVMRDKDIPGMLNTLAAACGAFVFTRASTSRSADPDELAGCLRRIAPALPYHVEPRPADALSVAWRIAPRIVTAGSIFLLGDVLKELGEA
jgi:dihydrofolate synthase/folylpolyglutamate synthase